MILCLFVFIPLALQYITCAIEDPLWSSVSDATDDLDGSVELDYDIFSNETNVTTTPRSIIDLDGLQMEEDANTSENTNINDGLKLIVLFLNAYCTNNDLTFCTTYNRCKNKTTCSTNEFLDVNSNFISILMSKFTDIDDTHKLIELTDKMHDWTKFALVGVIVILKVIISYLLEKKFNLCGKLKTKIKDKKNKSNYAVGNTDYESDAEELKIMVSKPPDPLPVHAQVIIHKDPVYDVPQITPIPVMPPAQKTFTTPPEKPPRA